MDAWIFGWKMRRKVCSCARDPSTTDGLYKQELYVQVYNNWHISKMTLYVAFPCRTLTLGELVSENRTGESFPASVEMQSLSSEINNQNSPMNSSKVSWLCDTVPHHHSVLYRTVVLMNQYSIQPQWIHSSHKRSVSIQDRRTHPLL